MTETKNINNSIINDNYEILLNELKGNSLFMPEHDNITALNSKGIVVVKLTQQSSISEVAKQLQELLDVTMLLSYSRKNKTKIILFSEPYIDKLYSITIMSDRCGLVDDFFVTFYSSMEVMMNDLSRYFTDEKTEFEEFAITYIDFLKHFIR